ncbi:hypothetical protein L1049_004306 [Liquidambar formosana]|uniref:GDSL esterase/lipase 5 n=1 Tax=Liquidambar formosana TaxID=63359 RepID=A0AAP0RT45_LIQFO
MARLGSFSSLWILHILLIPGSCLSNQPRRPENNAALFIFGDSFLDSGNNNYINTTTLDQANFWPYGETYFKYPTGRFSDGRLVSDFIAEYAKLPLIRPFLQPGIRQYDNGVNLASAGAGALVETFQGSVIDLKTQLRYFKKVETWFRHKFGNPEAKARLSSAVYLFSIGTNDYMSPFLTNSTLLDSYSESQYVGMVIGNLTTIIKGIYRRGGRKFGFINVVDLGCVPGLRIINSENNGTCLEEASILAKLHNEALSKLLATLENQLHGFKYSLFDFNSNIRRRMDHPSKYGLMEGKTACCGKGQFRGIFSCGGKRAVKEFQLCKNPSEYVFWDSFHLTEKVYKQLADQMWRGTGNTHAVGPYNLKNLFQ